MGQEEQKELGREIGISLDLVKMVKRRKKVGRRGKAEVAKPDQYTE